MEHTTDRLPTLYEKGTDRTVKEYSANDVGHMMLNLLSVLFEGKEYNSIDVDDPIKASVDWMIKLWSFNGISCDCCFRLAGQVMDYLKDFDDDNYYNNDIDYIQVYGRQLFEIHESNHATKAYSIDREYQKKVTELLENYPPLKDYIPSDHNPVPMNYSDRIKHTYIGNDRIKH